jgi:hypothetical protein
MTTKNSNRRSNAAKRVVKSSGTHHQEDQQLHLSDHVDLIRRDILKLREDIMDGYDFLKSSVEKKDWKSFWG